MRVTVIPIIVGALGTVPKPLEKGLERLEIGGRIKSIHTLSIVEIGQNIQKGPAYLKRLAVT